MLKHLKLSSFVYGVILGLSILSLFFQPAFANPPNFPDPTERPNFPPSPVPSAVITHLPLFLQPPSPTPTPTSTPVINSLIGYWKMEEGEGNITNSNAQNSIDLELIANPNFPSWSNIVPSTSTINNYSVYFDGDNYAKLLNTSQNSLFDFNKYTIEAWIKSDTQGLQDSDGAIVSKWLNNQGWALLVSQKVANVLNSSMLFSASYVKDNNWHHIAITWDSIKLVIYIDAQFQGFLYPFPTNPPISVDKTLYFATYNPPYHNFKGYIDEVKIYNYALSQPQIAQDAGIIP